MATNETFFILSQIRRKPGITMIGRQFEKGSTWSEENI
jgi:hypothetical protein